MRFHTRRLLFTTGGLKGVAYRGNMLFFYLLFSPTLARVEQAEGSRRKACSIYTRRFSIFRLSIIHCGQPSLVLLLCASCAGAARNAPTAFPTSLFVFSFFPFLFARHRGLHVYVYSRKLSAYRLSNYNRI